MRRNLKLIVQYDGTDYYGFCKQPGLRTIQGELERSLKELTGEKTIVYGSGRTDAGVHALGQVVNFRAATTVPIERLAEAVNTFLPKDIRALEARNADPDFHARKSARSKKYVYTMFSGVRLPYYLKRYSYHEKRKVSLPNMKKALKYLTGEHDFWSYSVKIGKDQNTVRKIFKTGIKAKRVPGFGNIFEITFIGNGFLYKMVRRLTAAVVGSGVGRIETSDVQKALQTKDRKLVPGTLPPQGLCLVEVNY